MYREAEDQSLLSLLLVVKVIPRFFTFPLSVTAFLLLFFFLIVLPLLWTGFAKSLVIFFPFLLPLKTNFSLEPVPPVKLTRLRIGVFPRVKEIFSFYSTRRVSLLRVKSAFFARGSLPPIDARCTAVAFHLFSERSTVIFLTVSSFSPDFCQTHGVI